MSVLALRSVSKSFGGVHAVREVSFAIREGEFLAMIGKNVIPRAALRNDEPDADHAAYINLLLREHQEIVSAISNGDEEGARAAMRRHLRGSQARYRKLLHEQLNLYDE